MTTGFKPENGPARHPLLGQVCMVCRTMELCEEVARRHGMDAITLDGDRVSRRGVVSGGSSRMRADPSALNKAGVFMHTFSTTKTPY